jgi:hypothetical protein
MLKKLGISVITGAVVVAVIAIALSAGMGRAATASADVPQGLTLAELSATHVTLGAATAPATVSQTDATAHVQQLFGASVIDSKLDSCTVPDGSGTVIPACWVVSIAPHQITSGYIAGQSKPFTAESVLDYALVDASKGNVVFAVQSTTANPNDSTASPTN